MADFDFFHQFRDKMRSLRPSARTAGEDWQALSQRLDMAMPATLPGRRWRMAAAALLLLLLASNLWWGFTFERQNGRLEHLTAEMAALKTVAPPTACEEVKTLREQVAAMQSQLGEAKQAALHRPFSQPVFEEKQAGFFSKKASGTGGSAPDFSETALAGQTAFSENGQEETGNAAPGFPEKTDGASGAGDLKSGGNFKLPPDLAAGGEAPAAALAPAEMLPPVDFALLKWTVRPPSLPTGFTPPPVPKHKPPVTKKIAAALQPKTFRIGATAGWLYPFEADLEYQTGYGYGLLAEAGFSRQLSLSAEWGRASLHYKALAQDAAIGLPSLPLPAPEHRFLEMDVSNQRLVFFGLGLRYKGLPKSSWHPFGSLGWSGMKVLPFEAHYETEASGSIFKGIYPVQQSGGLKNFARLGAGVEFPLGRRFDWSLEGYYLHAWRNGEPDLAGVRTALRFIF